MRRGGRRGGWLAWPIVAGALAGACSSIPDPPSSTPPPTVIEVCGVVQPTTALPEGVPYQRPVPWVEERSGWIANDVLAVSLPRDGALPVIRFPDGQLRMKFPWWTRQPGQVTVATRLLGSPGPDIAGEDPEGYGDLGFQPSGLYFSEPGCWEVTGRVGEGSLSFVVAVCEGDPVTRTCPPGFGLSARPS